MTAPANQQHFVSSIDNAFELVDQAMDREH
jgi:hypothetical protein